MKQGALNIGLSHYQEGQWLVAIKKYGKQIMDKSLLSHEQKAILAAEEVAKSINKASY